MEKGPKQQYVDIRPIPFQNEYYINNQLENTGMFLVVSQPTSQLYSVVYPISEANSSTKFNLLIRFKQNR